MPRVPPSSSSPTATPEADLTFWYFLCLYMYLMVSFRSFT